jgi:preprotein translocase subunit YajC
MDQTTLVIVYMVIIIGVFYFLWIRPQQRQRRAANDMLAALRPGDEVLTAGGIVGSVRSLGDEIVEIEIADGVVCRFTKTAIVRRRDIVESVPPAADE